jgi:hypothetical protein
MSDESEWTPHHRYVTPRSNPGEHLWSLLKDIVRYRLELRDHERKGAGCELQLFRNNEFIRGRRFKNRALAIAEADALHDTLKAQGWIGRRRRILRILRLDRAGRVVANGWRLAISQIRSLSRPQNLPLTDSLLQRAVGPNSAAW